MSVDYLVNENIRASDVRVVAPDGSPLGVMSLNSALEQARESDLDLVQISDNTAPPVCRITDYSKFRYEIIKKAKESAKKSRASAIEVKEIQLRPVTDSNDIAIKAKHAQEFLMAGDKVKIVVKFKGREIHHAEMGQQVMDKFLSSVGEHRVEKQPGLNARQLFAIIAPAMKK